MRSRAPASAAPSRRRSRATARRGLARVLATDAVFLLLDEPAAGMTERERDELLRLLAACATPAAASSWSTTTSTC
jgi:ABC-type branched-subunit amino acid transport system ATPase component